MSLELLIDRAVLNFILTIINIGIIIIDVQSWMIPLRSCSGSGSRYQRLSLLNSRTLLQIVILQIVILIVILPTIRQK